MKSVVQITKCEDGYKCCKSMDNASEFCCIADTEDCKEHSCRTDPSPSLAPTACGSKVDSSGHVLDVGRHAW